MSSVGSLTRKGSYDTRRMSSNESRKVYEQMLLKELPGNKRSNQPMHAVLESSLDDDVPGGMKEAQKVRNHALIHYLASLANSNNNEDKFDFDFVESLILNGADINSTDKTGQTIFHEVARSWNLDVASFLIEHGANINQQDKFGRSPLHVAAAVDYADMVQFLVKNGADINIATYGEGQMPIHYAAKNDGCRSLKMLLGYGADIDSRDSKKRSPLQVAAEMNRAKSAKLLVQQGAPAGVYDHIGNSALSLLIEKLPDVAIEALDQFHSVSTINRKEYFFLNYLEGNRLHDPKSPCYSALEIAVQNQEFDIILHPVMQRLILVKWQRFGRQGAVIDLVLNLIYAILWTSLAIFIPKHGVSMYVPVVQNIWRVIISVIVAIMTVDEIRKQIRGTLKTRKRQKKWISWRVAELQDDLAYCHPRWPQEEIYFRSEIEAIRDTPLISTGEAWLYFDWFSLILILGSIASQMVYMKVDTVLSRIIYLRIIIALLLVLWLRILKYARPFEGAGPFVAIFGHIFWDIFNWGLLLLVLGIPFGCAFWITFGEASENPIDSYRFLSPLLYNMFSMVVVDDHDFELLEEADSTMARLLCGSYIGIMAIINLNLLIALLSDTFTRVYGNAVANAVMQRAKTILLLEKSLSSKKRRAYHEFIKSNGSPETVDLHRDITTSSDRDDQKSSDQLKENVKEMHALLNDRLGKRYGEGQKSDLDLVRESLAVIQESTGRESSNMKEVKRRLNKMQEAMVKLGNALDVEIPHFSQDSSTDEDSLEKNPSPKGERRRSYNRMETSENIDNHENEIPVFNNARFSSDESDNVLEGGIPNEAYQIDEFRVPGKKGRESRANSYRSFDGETRLDHNEEQLRQSRAKRSGMTREDSCRLSRRKSYAEQYPEESGEAREERPGKSRAMPKAVSDRELRRESSQWKPDGLHAEGQNVLRRDHRESGNPRSEFTAASPQLKRLPKMTRSDRSIDNRKGQKYTEASRSPEHRRDPDFNELANPRSKFKYRGSKSGRNSRDRRSWQKPTSSAEEYKTWQSHSDDERSQSESEEPHPRFRGTSRSYEDDEAVFHSDNDLFRKRRQRSSKQKCYYDSWDNRSVKSVTF